MKYRYRDTSNFEVSRLNSKRIPINFPATYREVYKQKLCVRKVNYKIKARKTTDRITERSKSRWRRQFNASNVYNGSHENDFSQLRSAAKLFILICILGFKKLFIDVSFQQNALHDFSK